MWGKAIATDVSTKWATPRVFDGVVNEWATAVIPLTNPDADFNFIIHKDNTKSPDLDLAFKPNVSGFEVWVLQDFDTPFFSLKEATAQIGNLSAQLDLSEIPMIANDSRLPADWNRTANFMEIYVRSYKDSNGDGNGDLQGIISKLDYLQSLGITGIWLTPIMRSFDHDHGYGVVDYRKIEPSFGTMKDFETLVFEAHNRGIGIILDYVMNHSSKANPLFVDAALAKNNSKHNWFVFSDTDPKWSVWGKSPWYATSTGFFYSAFSSYIPDFNLKNQEVVNYHLNNLRFWLNKGVDGFRFDAAGVLTENGVNAWNNQPENHKILKQVQDVITSYSNRFMVCEAPEAPDAYAVSTSCINAFAFGHQDDVINSATKHTLDASLAGFFISATRSHMPLILSNHDSFVGSRPYNALKSNQLGDYKVAANIYLLASNTPFTYYGEEIGMANGTTTNVDVNIRTPMSWTSNATNAGFSTVTPYRGISGNVATFNVEAENLAPDSLLQHYRSLYNLRKNNPVLGNGSFFLNSSAGDGHLMFTRKNATQTAAVFINLSLASKSLSMNVGVNNGNFTQKFPETNKNFTSNATGVITVDVPAQSAVVLIK